MSRVSARAVLAAQRRAILRDRGRRRRTVLLGALAAAAALAGGWWIVTGPPGRISSVALSGYGRPDKQALEETMRLLARRGTVLRPPVGLLREAARRFPWVEDISVSRDLPRGLAIRVVQARPAAVGVPSRGPRVLISSTGRILGAAGRPAPPLPRVRLGALTPITGQRLTDPGTRAALAFEHELKPALAGRIVAIHQEGTALVGRLSGGPELRLGLAENLPEKARALATVLGQLSAREERSASYIDLAVPRRPAVGPPVEVTTTTDGTTTSPDATGKDASGQAQTPPGTTAPGTTTAPTVDPSQPSTSG